MTAASGRGARDRAWWRFASPIGTLDAGDSGGHAIAIIEIGGDAQGALHGLFGAEIGVGRVSLRRVESVDELVVARVSDDRAMLFVHGGHAVIRAAAAWLDTAGLRRLSSESLAPLERHPEAADEDEAAMLDLLGMAHSPLAIDWLLDQPRRWREHREGRLGLVAPAHQTALSRLIHPATVVAIGPPNVGKSSLLNALAKRSVAVVADVAGTTRDHVGAQIDFGGVVANYLDSPGWDSSGDDSDPIQRAAQRLSRIAARGADLVLSCGDPISGFLPEKALSELEPPCGVLTVELRNDVTKQPPAPPPAALSTSVLRDLGLVDLVTAIRERLVPGAALADPGAFPLEARAPTCPQARGV